MEFNSAFKGLITDAPATFWSRYYRFLDCVQCLLLQKYKLTKGLGNSGALVLI